MKVLHGRVGGWSGRRPGDIEFPDEAGCVHMWHSQALKMDILSFIRVEDVGGRRRQEGGSRKAAQDTWNSCAILWEARRQRMMYGVQLRSGAC